MEDLQQRHLDGDFVLDFEGDFGLDFELDLLDILNLVSL